tara:strand:+ start:25167 stop:25448 length:282 start_codon:yes stop_codon:yes gene_type:complete
MGRTVEIECTAEIEIDEHVGEVSDEVLMEETIKRLEDYSDEVKNKFFKELLDYNEYSIVEAISFSKNLSIIDDEKLRNFLTNLGEYDSIYNLV